MGQRHQAWIIAKVNGRYRVLAVVHHQWAYGTLPIKAWWRLLQIMKHPANRRLAQHELIAAAGKDADWWEKQEHMVFKRREIAEAVPFPFLLTCLVLATSFDPRPDPGVGYVSRVHPLDIGTSWSQVDNNDGFSILDITDLESPKYCFTQINQWGEHDEEVEGTVACNTPMTDREYLRYYYSEAGPESASVLAKCPSLASWDIIEVEVLRNLWPSGTWKDRQDAGDSTVAHAEPSADSQPGGTKPSLSELALQKVVETALDEREMEEALDSVAYIRSLPGFLIRYMRNNPAAVKRPRGAQLLARAIKAEAGIDSDGLIDLSHWPLLSDDDVLYVVQHSITVNDIIGIDLSNNYNISAKCVKALVDLCPNLKTIVAIDTPCLPLSDLLTSLDSSRKGYDLFHSEHFRAAFGKSENVDETSVAPAMDWMASPYVGSLNTVTQILFYCDSPLTRAEARGQPAQEGVAPEVGVNNDSGVVWHEAIPWLKTLPRGLDVGDSFQPPVRSVPLRDAMLEPSRTADWFPQLFQLAIHHKNSIDRYNLGSICPEHSMAVALDIKVCSLQFRPLLWSILYAT